MTTKRNLILPIVHLNGTSANDLVDQRAAAIDALHAAGDALAKMAPNGRDYYPVTGLMAQAVIQHERRMNALKDLIAEIEAEMVAVDDLRSEHERAKRGI